MDGVEADDHARTHMRTCIPASSTSCFFLFLVLPTPLRTAADPQTLASPTPPSPTSRPKTLQGKPGPGTQGIIPSSFDYIFSSISDTSQVRYLVRASFLEIYNEEIRDLLDPDAKQHQSGKGLELKETKDKGVWVKDLGMVIVDSVPAIKKLLEVWAARAGPLRAKCCCTAAGSAFASLLSALTSTGPPAERQQVPLRRRDADEPGLVALALHLHHHRGVLRPGHRGPRARGQAQPGRPSRQRAPVQDRRHGRPPQGGYQDQPLSVGARQRHLCTRGRQVWCAAG